jgi:hypothetical protein
MQTAREITELAALATHSEAASTPSRVISDDIGSMRTLQQCNAFDALVSARPSAWQVNGLRRARMKSRMIQGSDTIRHGFDS